jgi:hypothetical protein
LYKKNDKLLLTRILLLNYTLLKFNYMLKYWNSAQDIE